MTPLSFLLISFAGIAICLVDHLADDGDPNYSSGLTLLGLVLFSLGSWGAVLAFISEYI